MKWLSIQSLIAWAYHRQGITAYSRWMTQNPVVPIGTSKLNSCDVAEQVITAIATLPTEQAAAIRASFTGRQLAIATLAEQIPEVMPSRNTGAIVLPIEYRINCVKFWIGATQEINFRAAKNLRVESLAHAGS